MCTIYCEIDLEMPYHVSFIKKCHISSNLLSKDVKYSHEVKLEIGISTCVSPIVRKNKKKCRQG